MTKATKEIIKVVQKRKLSAEDFKDVTKRVREQESLHLSKRKQVVDIDYLSDAELAKVLTAAEEKGRGVLARTLYETGMRVSAFCQLRTEDVLVEQRKVHARNTKGGKARLIPISEEMTETLVEWIGDPGPLFPAQNGGHYSRRRMQQIITDIGKAAGVHCYPHKLRKTRAMWLLGQKMPMPAISQFLGHADTSVTEGFYARMGVGMVADELDAVYARMELLKAAHRKAA